MPKPPSSASLDDSPLPNSTRPFGHEVEHRDPLGGARRVVELRRGEDDAVAEADVLRALAAAARNTSGAEEWLYSSRKWCSTSHTYWMPSRSASSTCSSASWMSVVLGVVVPRPADLVLVEDAELH